MTDIPALIAEDLFRYLEDIRDRRHEPSVICKDEIMRLVLARMPAPAKVELEKEMPSRHERVQSLREYYAQRYAELMRHPTGEEDGSYKERMERAVFVKKYSAVLAANPMFVANTCYNTIGPTTGDGQPLNSVSHPRKP